MDIFTLFKRMDRRVRKRLWLRIQEECNQFPHHLVQVPIDFQVPTGVFAPVELWKSKGYTVQVYSIPGNPEWERLSINRNAFNHDYTRFLDGMSWERIMEIKAEIGRGNCEALEIFPAEDDVVNVANMRHLWVRKQGSFIEEARIGWKRRSAESVVRDSEMDARAIAPGAASAALHDTRLRPARNAAVPTNVHPGASVEPGEDSAQLTAT